MDTYLGETAETWLELKRKALELDVMPLIRENASLRAKVSYYEARLDDIKRFREITTNPQN